MGKLSIHSEREIVDGCISLMNRLVGYFEKYLDFVGLDPTTDGDEEHFKVKFGNAEIVSRLLLWGTTHSGGTSTHEKCRELGIDPYEYTLFEDERGLED